MNLEHALASLSLNWIRENIQEEIATAARKQRSHQEFFERLIIGEKESRDAQMIERRLREARLPGLKNMENFDWSWPKRMNRDQIRKLVGQTAEKGLTLVPLELYFKSGRVKVLLALARGKQAHDKRETIRKREVDRETRAAVKARSR